MPSDNTIATLQAAIGCLEAITYASLDGGRYNSFKEWVDLNLHGAQETIDRLRQLEINMSREWEVNARLVAAAPDLLDACRQAVELFEDDEGIAQVLLAAILKATGENQNVE